MVFNDTHQSLNMRISTELRAALNNQIELEASASSTYLSMASWAEMSGYDGAASYFYAQSDEERTHMLKIVHYLNDIGAGSTIPAVQAPTESFESLEHAIKTALENEQAVTRAVHDMMDLARHEKDYSTCTFLEWFVNEQIHEESQFEAILQKFDIIGRDRLAIYEIDKILASRPSSTTE